MHFCNAENTRAASQHVSYGASQLKRPEILATGRTARSEADMKNILLAGMAGLLSATAVIASAPAFAGETLPAERQAIVTYLGGKASAVTYYVRNAKGYQVVTTLDAAGEPGAAPAVVRVSTVLQQPGDEQIVSLPGPLGRDGTSLRIVRVGDVIQVEKVGALAY
jgi:hypothetical protein